MNPKIKFIVYWGAVLSMVGIVIITLILTGIAFDISFSVPLAVGTIFTLSVAVWNEFLKVRQTEEKEPIYHQPAPLKKSKNLNEIKKDQEIFKTLVLRPSWFHYTGYFILSIIFLILVSIFFNRQFLIPGYFVFDYVGLLFSLSGHKVLEYIGYFLTATAVIALISVVLKKFTYTYTVTSNVLTAKKGIFSINEKEIRISNVREVVVKQDIIQRIFGIGSIFFSSAGKSGINVVFEGVKNPMSIKKQVNEIRDYIGE